MALSKEIEIYNTGLISSYWRIKDRQDDYDAGTISVSLFGYKDEDARLSGKTPIPVFRYIFTKSDLGVSSLHNVGTADLYNAIQSAKIPNVPSFSDALTV